MSQHIVSALAVASGLGAFQVYKFDKEVASTNAYDDPNTTAHVTANASASLWERLGGEEIVRPLANAIYDRHASDHLTKGWFSSTGDHNWLVHTPEQVKEHVFTFFSSGIGGPHVYKGRNMIDTHASIAKIYPLTKASVHAVIYHVLDESKKHGAGDREIDEIHDILHSLVPDVTKFGYKNYDITVGECETATTVFSFQDLTGVTPQLAFAVWTFAFLSLIVWRVWEALDSKRNNSGLAAFSSVFYHAGGGLTDFINALPYVFNLIPTATVFLGIYLAQATGNDWFTFMTFVAGFGLVPLLDLVVGEDSYNPTPTEEAKLRNNWWFRFWTCSYVWVYAGSVLAVARYIGQQSQAGTLSAVAFWGIASSLGISSGFGIGCIHELIHRPSFIELIHARVVLVLSNYNHFWVEHLWGHHKRVATDEDPASSFLNESFWTYIWKCLYLSLVSALRLEAKFLKNRGKAWYNIFENRILSAYLVSFAIDALIYKYFGLTALLAHIVQSFLTAFLTDNANYIEHYGLRRQRLSEAKDEWGWYSDYEAPGWMHSWNTGDRISNWMLFKIERHPDHHVNAGRPYQILRTYKESPTYPTGYAGMFVLSWIPPLFFAVMNPLVHKARQDLIDLRKSGKYEEVFPKGANNISSVYRKTGEDYYEPGSAEYGDGQDVDGKANEGGAVWAAGEAKDSARLVKKAQ